MWDFGDGVKVTQKEPVHTYALSGDYKVKLIAISYICDNDTTESLIKINITGIDDQKPIPSVSIYPNPVNEKLFVDLNLTQSGKVSYSLFSLSGKEILSNELDLPQGFFHEIINIPNLRTGVYYLQIKSPQGVLQHKIIVK